MTALGTIKRVFACSARIVAASLIIGMVCGAGAGSAQASFGVSTFENTLVSNPSNEPAMQAGSHPYALTTTIVFNHHETEVGPNPDGDPKDIEVNLPAGLVVNPRATVTTCGEALLETVGGCPDSTAVGVVTLDLDFAEKATEARAPIFNVTPPPGVPAELGFNVFGVGVVAHILGKVRTGTDYGLSAQALSVPQIVPVYGAKVTLWGNPSEPSHDPERGQCINEPALGSCPVDRRGNPLLTMPTQCSGSPLTATMRTDSWQESGAFVEPPGAEAAPLTGCARLAFTPSMTITPDVTAADSPTGLTVDLTVPHDEGPEGLAEANLKDAVVTLPPGMVVNPAQANGLGACGEEGANSVNLRSSTPAECPGSSKIGSVEVETPLLQQNLKGAVYLARQSANPFNALLAMYVVAEGSGVALKLAGHIEADAQDGRLTARFEGNPPREGTPDLPFSDLKLKLFGGHDAPLITPAKCGSYEAAGELTPWSGSPAKRLPSTFSINSNCGGAFAPSFIAGTLNNAAGAFSPLALALSRQDGEGRFGSLQIETPPGLLGAVKHVVQCQEPHAAEGTCGPESVIGHVTVGAGAGPDPFYIGGNVYFTGPYEGAPFGLSVVVHALAGPLDLGNVIVRAKITVDPSTAALTVTSDPLPLILKGIPLSLKTLRMVVDRPEFVLNPTSCAPKAVSGAVGSAQGATAAVSSPFEAANCARLSFKPTLTALTHAKTSKAGGAYLHVKVTSGAGEANIGKVKVALPKALPSRLTTLQKACPDAAFKANPALCPAASLVGTAVAATTLLAHPLAGPAYLVSHGGAAFPDLVVVLQGEGITVDLVGATDIKKGITTSTFGNVPDVPITSFDLVLPTGPSSVFAAYGSFCKTTLNMPTTITGQNGAVLTRTTRVAVSGCPKHGKKIARRKKSAKRNG